MEDLLAVGGIKYKDPQHPLLGTFLSPRILTQMILLFHLIYTLHDLEK